MLQARAFANCLRRVSTGRAEMQADIFPSRVLKIRNSPVYRASPALFQLPGLLSRPFHDPSEFEWVQRLHDSTDKILEECFKLKNTKVSDYVVGETEHTLHSDGKWEWHSFIMKGDKQESFKRTCPVTTKLLESIEGLQEGVPFAYSFFSTLQPGSTIAAHFGPTNLRLRCHLPLIVPDDCGIIVAGEKRTWEKGKLLIFDDSFEHEVFHNGTGDRIILLFDIWHPEIEKEERVAIIEMFDLAKKNGWISGHRES